MNAIDQTLDWIKAHKKLVLILVGLYVGYWLLFSPEAPIIQTKNSRTYTNMGMGGVAEDFAMERVGMMAPTTSYNSLPIRNVAPRPDVENRKVITNSNMSLLVKDVRATIEDISLKTRDLNGYVVDTSIHTTEYGESGNIIVRVPSATLDSTLDYFRNLAVKVVDEGVSGNDITDSYVDIEERLTRLNSTKARFEQILEDAETVEEILKVQREIFNLQDQIDNYKGQLQYFDNASSTTLINISLSTDELSLPYTPIRSWRPQVVFKQAVRSLQETLVSFGDAAIWLIVYLPLVILALAVYKISKKYYLNKKPNRPQK